MPWTSQWIAKRLQAGNVQCTVSWQWIVIFCLEIMWITWNVAASSPNVHLLMDSSFCHINRGSWIRTRQIICCQVKLCKMVWNGYPMAHCRWRLSARLELRGARWFVFDTIGEALPFFLVSPFFSVGAGRGHISRLFSSGKGPLFIRYRRG